jgi:hypothetical protein
MIIVPANHHGINTQEKINDAGMSVSHNDLFGSNIMPYQEFLTRSLLC